jgi:cyclophilin family peptidyl-prolyl cis-trans isomerase
MPGTPFLLIDGEIYSGPLSYANLNAIIQLKLLADKQFDTCPPMQIDTSKQYQATIKTEKGDIVLELLAEDAPMAVNNFIFLARQGWFDGTNFHRVVPGFVAQAGDPTGTSFGSPGYAFDNEIVPGLKFDQPGMVGMANAGPGTNGSQFFITMAPAPDLDGKYTIFGRVIAGMDVVEKLKERNPAQSLPAEPGDKIFSVVITEK